MARPSKASVGGGSGGRRQSEPSQGSHHNRRRRPIEEPDAVVLVSARMRLTLTLVVLTLLGARPWARADPARYDLRVELGTEYDSNPDRAEQIANYVPPAGASPLARLWPRQLASAWDRMAPSPCQGPWRASVSSTRPRAVTIFWSPKRAQTHARVAGRTILGVAGGYYDAFQRGPVDRRDFRSLAPALRIEQGFARAAQFTLGGGYRWFTFKSDDNFSFAGPTAFLTARQMFPGNLERGEADWEWTAGPVWNGVASRGWHVPTTHARPIFVSATPTGSILGESRRADAHNHVSAGSRCCAPPQPVE